MKFENTEGKAIGQRGAGVVKKEVPCVFIKEILQ